MQWTGYFNIGVGFCEAIWQECLWVGGIKADHIVVLGLACFVSSHLSDVKHANQLWGRFVCKRLGATAGTRNGNGSGAFTTVWCYRVLGKSDAVETRGSNYISRNRSLSEKTRKD